MTSAKLKGILIQQLTPTYLMEKHDRNALVKSPPIDSKRSCPVVSCIIQYCSGRSRFSQEWRHAVDRRGLNIAKKETKISSLLRLYDCLVRSKRVKLNQYLKLWREFRGISLYKKTIQKSITFQYTIINN